MSDLRLFPTKHL